MCYIAITLHVFDLTIISGGGRDGGGGTGKKAAKPVITLQDCASTIL